jgi:hypothetical protein
MEYIRLRELIRGFGWRDVAIIFSDPRTLAGGLNCRRLDALCFETEQSADAPPKRQIKRDQRVIIFSGKALWRTHRLNFSLYPARNASYDLLNYLIAQKQG